MAQAIPIKLMDELRTIQETYLTECYSQFGLKFDQNVKRPLKGILEFWQGEVENLKQGYPQVPTSNFQCAMLPFVVGHTVVENEQIARYQALAKRELEKVYKVIKEYAPEWLK